MKLVHSKTKYDWNRDRRRVLFASAAALLTAGNGRPASAETKERMPSEIAQPSPADGRSFMARAFEMRQRAVDLGDQAYGAVIVLDNIIIGQSWSRVVIDNDPTAHAEMAAIRDAAMRGNNRNLGGTIMYSSSRPCPMCEAAAYWAGISRLIYGQNANDAGSPVLCR